MARRYPQHEFIASGKLIERLTHNLKSVKDWTMEETMSYIGDQTRRSSDMIYRWQQGRLLPKAEIVEVLARIGHSQAELSREWCEEFLHATHYPETTNLLNELWGPKDLRTIPCRLARLEHTRLIGRQKEIKQLQDLLSPRYAAYLITVDGIGGVGKTALALDVAYQIWRASTGEIVKPHLPTFDAIIFVSAKQQYLTAQGLFPSTQVHSTLRKIFQEVTLTLERDDIRLTPLQEQPDLIREALGRQRTLLIVDNLETMEDKQEILSFLYQLPPTVKVVVTTRERAMFSPIRLEQLAEDAALELIKQQTKEKQVLFNQKEIQMLYKRIGGIPAALVYAIGQRAAGYSVETILNNVPRAEGDVARFCFQGSVEPLRGQKAHMMLMTFALFPQAPSRAAVTYVAGLEADLIDAEEALSQLQRLSLLREFRDRLRMLPLTREYALAELGAHPDFEQEARERWINWYLRFAQHYGGHDMEEWHVRFDRLDEEWENLLALFDWCASHERYDVIKAFWCAEEPGSVVDFTTLYGYWDDRLAWLSWLIDTAKGRGDWLTLLDAIASKAITLTLMNNPSSVKEKDDVEARNLSPLESLDKKAYVQEGEYQEAKDCFKEAQTYLSYAEPHVKVRLFINNAYLYIFLGSEQPTYFDKANGLLDQAMDAVQQVPMPLRTRFILNIEYDYAAVLYWRKEFAAAREAFNSVMERANTFGWQWLANYAQNYLGDIAVNEGDYDEAERLLEPGLKMAERNKEKRRIASYKRSLAYLRQKQGRVDDALAWAREARDGFDRLGIEHERRKMDHLIHNLRADISG
jgi:tetratricopeptide (TPR) repeat protein